MGRPSKLTDKQWSEIERRHLAGETVRSLAREFLVSEAAIRLRGVSAQATEIKEVAHQIVATQDRLMSLSLSAQVYAHSLANDLREVSIHLAAAAKFGAMTSHRLAQVAHSSTDKIDETGTLEDNENAIKMVAAMTKCSNDAAHVGLNLLSANKEMMTSADKSQAKETPKLPPREQARRIAFALSLGLEASQAPARATPQQTAMPA